MRFEISLPFFFNLDTTMDSEQCPGSFFFWKREESNNYSRVCKAHSTYYKLSICQNKSSLLVKLTPELGQTLYSDIEHHARELLKLQFRFDDNFEEILEYIGKWPEIEHLFTSVPGLRLMQDVDLFERVCDSICSQNTSIQHLNRMMHNLAIRLGKRIVFDDGSEHLILPGVEEVAQSTLEELQQCSMGYRAKYLLKSSQMLYTNYSDWFTIRVLEKSKAEEKIRTLPGVGPKVAALILMFGYGRTDVFPVDVWVQRGLLHLYGWEGSIEKLKQRAEDRFGVYSAYINNYIFYMFRKGLWTGDQSSQTKF